jgi:hypothetical protein
MKEDLHQELVELENEDSQEALLQDQVAIELQDQLDDTILIS